MTVDERAARPQERTSDIGALSFRRGLGEKPRSPAPTTERLGVVFAMGDSVLTDVRVAGRRGTLTIKNAAVFHTTEAGELLDVQTIVDGSGELAGASGVIRTVGTFVNGVGRSEYDGFVCVP